MPQAETQDIWKYIYYGNTVEEYFTAFLIFLIGILALYLFRNGIMSRFAQLAKKTENDVDDTIVKALSTIRAPFYSYLSLYIASLFLILDDSIRKILEAILIIWVIYQVMITLQILINYITEKKIAQNRKAQAAISITSVFIKWALWTLGLLLILSNLGVDITSLVAGLGVGGIAVALAVQNILGDLLSYFAILFDRPFVVGDFISVGNVSGTVKKIGIKTTRIAALQGEEVIVPNKELTSTQVQNYKKLKERRIAFNIGVTYDTKTTTMKKIPELIKKAFESVGEIRFGRAHFKNFADSSLIFEIVYFVEQSDYNLYMDKNQEILLNIKTLFEKHHIEFAFPTQTVYVAKH